MNRHPPVSDANQVAEGTTFIAMPSYPLESIADEMQAPIGLHVRNNSQLFEYPFVHRQHMSAITLGGLMMVVSLFENSLLGFIGGATLTFGCSLIVCKCLRVSARVAFCTFIMLLLSTLANCASVISVLYTLVQSSSSQEQTEGNTQQGVFIASSIFWACCSIAAASLAHRTRQSYLALIRHNSQVQPFHEPSVIDVGSRIMSAPAYSHVPMMHASVPIASLPGVVFGGAASDDSLAPVAALPLQPLPPGVPSTWAPQYGEPQYGSRRDEDVSEP